MEGASSDLHVYPSLQSLNSEMQSCDRDQMTRENLDPIKANYETAEADFLRARVIAHMGENIRMDQRLQNLVSTCQNTSIS